MHFKRILQRIVHYLTFKRHGACHGLDKEDDEHKQSVKRRNLLTKKRPDAEDTGPSERVKNWLHALEALPDGGSGPIARPD